MKNNNLYGWVFTFNPNTDVWNATPNDNYFALFNGHNERVISSKEITTLMDIINRTNGNIEGINKLLKNIK